MSWRDAAPDLPPGWVWTELADVADVHLGKMLDAKKQTGKHPRKYLRNSNVQWHNVGLDDLLTMDIAPEESDRYSLRAGDLVICEGGEPGRCAVVPPAADGLAFQKALHRLRAALGVSVDYLAYAFEHMTRAGYTSNILSGSTIKHLPLEKLRTLPVPLPPTSEQVRIAAQLALLRTQIDRAQEQTAGVLRLLNALESRLLTDFAAGHATKPLRNLLAEPLRNGFSAKEVPGGDGVPVYSITAVTRRDFGRAHLKATNVSRDRAEGLFCEPGDIFIQRSNTPELVGSAAIYRGPQEAAIFPDLLIRIRANHTVAPEYLGLYLRTPAVRRYFRSRAKGLAGTMPKISQGTVLDLPVPDLPREEQEQQAAALTTQLDRIAASRRDLNALKVRLDALWASSLRAGLAGQMVAQDAADASAHALLEAITSQRLATQATARRRSTGTVRGAQPAAAAVHLEESA